MPDSHDTARLGRDVNTILAASTPLRIDRPQGLPRIKTVRGGLGTPQNQDDPGSSQLSYANEPAFGAINEQKVTFVQEVGEARVLMGSMAPQTFTNDTAVDPATDNITVVDHGFVTGDGPVRVTSAAGNVPAGINRFAGSLLIYTAQPADTETVTIDAKTYTFQTVLTNVDGNVLIGAAIVDTRDNLVAAINLAAGAGTLYAAATTLHPTVTTLLIGNDDIMSVRAKNAGAGGNAIATTETLANGSWDDNTLIDGEDTDYFVVTVDDDDFQLALTRQDAQDGTVVDITADGTGTSTVDGTHNVGFSPANSIQDGSSGVLLEVGKTLTVWVPSVVTLVGDTGAVTSYFFA